MTNSKNPKKRALIAGILVAITCAAIYIATPFVRANSIERAIEQHCRMSAFYPSKLLPQTEWLRVGVDNANTNADLQRLFEILQSNAPYLKAVDICIHGNKWEKADFGRFSNLERVSDIQIKIEDWTD